MEEANLAVSHVEAKTTAHDSIQKRRWKNYVQKVVESASLDDMVLEGPPGDAFRTKVRQISTATSFVQKAPPLPPRHGDDDGVLRHAAPPGEAFRTTDSDTDSSVASDHVSSQSSDPMMLLGEE